MLPLAPKLLYNHTPESCLLTSQGFSPNTRVSSLDRTIAFQAAKDYILRENQRK